MKSISIRKKYALKKRESLNNQLALWVSIKGCNIYIYYGKIDIKSYGEKSCLPVFDKNDLFNVARTREFFNYTYFKRSNIKTIALMLYDFSKSKNIFKNRAKILQTTLPAFNKIYIDKKGRYIGGEFSKGYYIFNIYDIPAIKGIILKEYKNQKGKYKICGIVTSDLSQEFIQYWDIKDCEKLKGYDEARFKAIIEYVYDNINDKITPFYINSKVDLDIPFLVSFFERNINPKTGYNIRGFNKASINAVTNLKYDLNGFNKAGINFFTKAKFSKDGINYNGLKANEKRKLGYNGKYLDE